MNIETIIDWFSRSGGISQLILGILGGGIGAYFTERLRNYATQKDIGRITRNQEEVKSEFSEKLERLRSSNIRESDFFKTTMMNFSQGHLAAQDRRLRALEIAWQSTLKLKEETRDAFFFLGSVLPSDYESAMEKPQLRELLENVAHHAFTGDLFSYESEFQQQRLFLGDDIWEALIQYQALLGNVYVNLARGYAARKISPPIDDEATLRLLGMLMTQEELAAVIKSEKFIDMILATVLIEQRIISKVARLIGGEAATAASFEMANRMQIAINAYNKISNFF